MCTSHAHNHWNSGGVMGGGYAQYSSQDSLPDSPYSSQSLDSQPATGQGKDIIFSLLSVFLRYRSEKKCTCYTHNHGNSGWGRGGAQCTEWQNIAKKLQFFSKPNWVARINIWIMPVQNLTLLSCFGTSKVQISVPKVRCLRQNFRFNFTVVILLSKFLEKPNKVRA